MSPRTRAALVAATVIALVVLFVALRPTEDTTDDAPVAAQETTPPVAVAPSGPTGTTATPSAKPKVPEITKIDVKALEPVGGVADLKARKGDTVRFTVSSDQAENVHLHGYDIEKQVAPGNPARFSVKTDIEGIFEVELENSAVPVAELTVNP